MAALLRGKCGIVHQTATEYMGCTTCNPPYAPPPLYPIPFRMDDDMWRSEVTAFVRWHCRLCGEVPGDSKWLRTVEVGQNKFKYQHALCGTYLGDAPAPGTTPPASQSETDDVLDALRSHFPKLAGISPAQALKSAVKTLNHAVWRGGPISTGVGGTQPNPSPQPAATVPVCHVCGLQNHATDHEKAFCVGYPMTALGTTCIGCGAGPGDPHIDHPGLGPCPRRQAVLRAAGIVPYP